MELNQEKWRTTTSYDGDNVTVVPPNGGTVTTTYKDARDRVTACGSGTVGRRPGPTTRRGTATRSAMSLPAITDAAGNVWRYTYDVLGSKTYERRPGRGHLHA